MSATAAMESTSTLAPSKPSGTVMTQPDHRSHSLRRKASKNRFNVGSTNSNTNNTGGISDPEEYSSMVAAAVANIVSSSGGKSEEHLSTNKDYGNFYNLDDYDAIGNTDIDLDGKGSINPFDLDTIDSITNSKSSKKGKGVSGGGSAAGKGLKKNKSKVVRTKSKTKTNASAGGVALRKSATIKGASQQDSYGSLATTVQNAVSHSGVAKVPAPTILPRTPNIMDLHLYLNRIQHYFNQLGYHRIGEPKIRVLTNMSMKHHVDTSRALIKAGEPIKCLHALILAIHFTNCSNHIERFSINFKSEFNGKEYKHVVLGVFLYGMFGALGISRDPGLQDKPISYPRLYELIMDYQACYAESGHILHEVKIGGVITHDPHSVEPINWKVGNSVIIEGSNASVVEATLEKISKQLRSKMGATCLRNVRPTQMVYPTIPSEQPPASAILNVPLRPVLPQAKKSKIALTNNNTAAATKTKSTKK